VWTSFPVDVFAVVRRPEAIIDAIIKLRKKIANESMQERGQIKQTHRYYSTTHNLKVIADFYRKYLQSETRSSAPKELMEAMGMPVPAQSVEKEEIVVAEESCQPHLSQLENAEASQLRSG